MLLTSTTKGVLYFLSSIGFIALVDTTCKFFTDELHAVVLVWGYFVGITVFVTGYFTIRGQLGFLTTDGVAQIVRPVFGALYFRSVRGADLPAYGAEATPSASRVRCLLPLCPAYAGGAAGWHRWRRQQGWPASW